MFLCFVYMIIVIKVQNIDYMRDINRIDVICDKLKEAQKIVPDQRFGQFILNYIASEGLLYYYEDDKTEQALDRMLNNEE